jgi:hypothetical protein
MHDHLNSPGGDTVVGHAKMRAAAKSTERARSGNNTLLRIIRFGRARSIAAVLL